MFFGLLSPLALLLLPLAALPFLVLKKRRSKKVVLPTSFIIKKLTKTNPRKSQLLPPLLYALALLCVIGLLSGFYRVGTERLSIIIDNRVGLNTLSRSGDIYLAEVKNQIKELASSYELQLYIFCPSLAPLSSLDDLAIDYEKCDSFELPYNKNIAILSPYEVKISNRYGVSQVSLPLKDLLPYTLSDPRIEIAELKSNLAISVELKDVENGNILLSGIRDDGSKNLLKDLPIKRSRFDILFASRYPIYEVRLKSDEKDRYRDNNVYYVADTVLADAKHTRVASNTRYTSPDPRFRFVASNQAANINLLLNPRKPQLGPYNIHVFVNRQAKKYDLDYISPSPELRYLKAQTIVGTPLKYLPNDEILLAANQKPFLLKRIVGNKILYLSSINLFDKSDTFAQILLLNLLNESPDSKTFFYQGQTDYDLSTGDMDSLRYFKFLLQGNKTVGYGVINRPIYDGPVVVDTNHLLTLSDSHEENLLDRYFYVALGIIVALLVFI